MKYADAEKPENAICYNCHKSIAGIIASGEDTPIQENGLWFCGSDCLSDASGRGE